jgi:hypothetical protein
MTNNGNNNTNNGIPMVTAVPVHPNDPASQAPPPSQSSGTFATEGIPSSTSISTTGTIPVPGNKNLSPHLNAQQIDQLQRQGFPLGLAAELGKMRVELPVRFWIVDNSGEFL